MRRRLFIAVVLLLAALALRLVQLDFRALWWDEGLSLFFARLGYLEQARFAVLLADTNPPIYRMLLGLWTQLAGSSAWSARLFSVFAGVVLVAGTFRLAADIRPHHSAAVIAAALAAASPMLVYYGQEAKGYSLVAAAGVLAVLIWRRLCNRPSAARWAGWGLCVLLALGSHYIFAFLLLSMNAWSLWRSRRLGRTHVARLIGAQAVVGLLLLPFVTVTFTQTTAAVRGETGDFTGLDGPGAFLLRHLIEFALGPRGASASGLALAALLVLAGGYGALRARRDGAIMASMIGGPLLLGMALNSYHEFFFPRFLLYCVPLLLVLAAVGLDALPRAAGWVGATAIVLAFAPTLRQHYADAGDPLEDWRPLAAAVQPLLAAGDGAVYVWGWMPGYLHAYLPPAPEPTYRLGYFTPENLAGDLTAMAAQHERIWLFDYQIDTFDVRNGAGRWLGRQAGLAYAQWFGNAHVSLFVQPKRSACTRQTAQFVNGLRVSFCRREIQTRPGGAVAVELAWDAVDPPADPLTVYLHVLDAAGRWAAGRDASPHNGLLPFNEWNGLGALADPRATVLPPDLPPGAYTVRIGLYDPATGRRVPTEAGTDGVTVAALRVN